MARTNFKLNVRQPGIDGLSLLLVWTQGHTGGLRIPRRYPFADIANYAALKTSGFFRHVTTDVSSEMGGSKIAGDEGVLGYQLPRTEKLVLLVKKGDTADEFFTILGSKQYSIDDLVITVPAGAIGDVYECDLFNMGLFIGGEDGEPGIIFDVAAATLDFCLIVRSMG